MQSVLYFSETSKQALLLFIDAYLNIFYELNRLVAKYPRKEDSVQRRDVWKLIQLAYTELLKCASKVNVGFSYFDRLLLA